MIDLILMFAVDLVMLLFLFILWILILPLGLVAATPVILAISLFSGKPVSRLFGNLIYWWVDIIPSFPRKRRKLL